MDAGKVTFDPAPYRQSADDAVSNEARCEARALDEAKAFLREQLADGSKPATVLFEAAKEEGIGVSTMRRAGKCLGVSIRKAGLGGKSIWTLPGQDSLIPEEVS